MADLAKRFTQNPIIKPQDVKPSSPELEVIGAFNPGAFSYQNNIYLLLRVAERPLPKEGVVRIAVHDSTVDGSIKLIEYKKDDPDLKFTDPQTFLYKGRAHLATTSHLRLAKSKDGINFEIDKFPSIVGDSSLEPFGLEDCRVVKIADEYYLTYTSVSPDGICVGMMSTKDWIHFHRHGLIFPPHDKDCALFPEKIGNNYFALHRPSGICFGGHNIWICRSNDLIHWGEHSCLARTRYGYWDSDRIGANSSPLKTDHGWLVIYHGVNEKKIYCLGAMLLDLENPSEIIARSDEPIMEPTTNYEKNGFFSNIVFTNGHLEDGDKLTIYYGGADSVTCGASFSIKEILSFLKV
ncbi:MAG: glycoside hydrolase family 130 protein [Candidatus Margulisbacteria bacterium]|nr:glycoside hydrolase family 130 protein [Candidatus Margulisiibacteriota bacterium]